MSRWSSVGNFRLSEQATLYLQKQYRYLPSILTSVNAFQKFEFLNIYR